MRNYATSEPMTAIVTAATTMWVRGYPRTYQNATVTQNNGEFVEDKIFFENTTYRRPVVVDDEIAWNLEPNDEEVIHRPPSLSEDSMICFHPDDYYADKAAIWCPIEEWSHVQEELKHEQTGGDDMQLRIIHQDDRGMPRPVAIWSGVKRGRELLSQEGALPRTLEMHHVVQMYDGESWHDAYDQLFVFIELVNARNRRKEANV